MGRIDHPPEEGFLDDDFARFRSERLGAAGRPGQDEPTEEVPSEEEEVTAMFFGTSPLERLRLRVQGEKERSELEEDERRLLEHRRRDAAGPARSPRAGARGGPSSRSVRRPRRPPPGGPARPRVPSGEDRRRPAPPLGTRIRPDPGRQAS